MSTENKYEIVKTFENDFKENLNKDEILVFPVSYVTNLKIDASDFNDYYAANVYSLRHLSGWKIIAKMKTDNYKWIQDFRASHKKYGTIYGNFNKSVYAESEESYNDFIKNHPYQKICIKDITKIEK